MDFANQFSGDGHPGGRLRNEHHIAPNIGEILRVKAQNFGALLEIAQHRAQVFWRGRTHVAEVLRNDPRRRENIEVRSLVFFPPGA